MKIKPQSARNEKTVSNTNFLLLKDRKSKIKEREWDRLLRESVDWETSSPQPPHLMKPTKCEATLVKECCRSQSSSALHTSTLSGLLQRMQYVRLGTIVDETFDVSWLG